VEGSGTATIVHLPDHVAIKDRAVLQLVVRPARLHLFRAQTGNSITKPPVAAATVVSAGNVEA